MLLFFQTALQDLSTYAETLFFSISPPLLTTLAALRAARALPRSSLVEQNSRPHVLLPTLLARRRRRGVRIQTESDENKPSPLRRTVRMAYNLVGQILQYKSFYFFN